MRLRRLFALVLVGVGMVTGLTQAAVVPTSVLVCDDDSWGYRVCSVDITGDNGSVVTCCAGYEGFCGIMIRDVTANLVGQKNGGIWEWRNWSTFEGGTEADWPSALPAPSELSTWINTNLLAWVNGTGVWPEYPVYSGSYSGWVGAVSQGGEEEGGAGFVDESGTLSAAVVTNPLTAALMGAFAGLWPVIALLLSAMFAAQVVKRLVLEPLKRREAEERAERRRQRRELNRAWRHADGVSGKSSASLRGP